MRALTLSITKAQVTKNFFVTWAFVMERVTGIEAASRAWELPDLGRKKPLSSRFD
jgi:hypothetical protein